MESSAQLYSTVYVLAPITIDGEDVVFIWGVFATFSAAQFAAASSAHPNAASEIAPFDLAWEEVDYLPDVRGNTGPWVAWLDKARTFGWQINAEPIRK